MEDKMMRMLKAFYNKNVIEFIVDDLNTQLMKIGYYGIFISRILMILR